MRQLSETPLTPGRAGYHKALTRPAHKSAQNRAPRTRIQLADGSSDRRYRERHGHPEPPGNRPGHPPADHLRRRPHRGARRRLAAPAAQEVPGHRPSHRPRAAEGNDVPRRPVQARDGRARRRRTHRRLVGLRGSAPPPHPPRHRRRLQQGRDQARSHHLRADASGLVRRPVPARRHGRQPRPVRPVFPHLPPLLRPDVHRGRRPRTRPALRPRLQRLDGGGVVRPRRERPPDTTAPDPPLGPGVGRRGGPPQRGPRHPRRRLLRDTPAPRPALHPHRRLGPVPRRLRRDRHGHRDAHRLQQPDAVDLGGRAARRRLHDHLRQLLLLDGGLADERQVRTLPGPQGHVRRGPDRLDPLHPGARRRRLGGEPRLGRRRRQGPPPAVRTLHRARLRLLLRRRVRPEEPRLDRRRERPLRDRLPPLRLHLAQVPRGRRGTDGSPGTGRGRADRTGQRDRAARADTGRTVGGPK